MQYKLMGYGVGIFAAGISLGWAFTADYYERKAKALEDLIEYAEADVEMVKGDSENEAELRIPFKVTNTSNDDPEFESFAPPEAYVGDGDEHPKDVLAEERIAAKLAKQELREKEKQDVRDDQGDTSSSSGSEGRSEDLEEAPEAEEQVVPPGETEEETRSKLQDLIDQYTASPQEAAAFTEAAYKEVTGQNFQPFVISQAEYAWDEEGQAYDKETLTYFPRERVLVDDDEEVIDDVRGVIGWPNLNRFGDESEDADIVFVRNRRLNTDYEVVRDEENRPPLHVRYGMPREEFNTHKAAGTLRLREEDQ